MNRANAWATDLIMDNPTVGLGLIVIADWGPSVSPFILPDGFPDEAFKGIDAYAEIARQQRADALAWSERSDTGVEIGGSQFNAAAEQQKQVDVTTQVNAAAEQQKQADLTAHFNAAAQPPVPPNHDDHDDRGGSGAGGTAAADGPSSASSLKHDGVTAGSLSDMDKRHAGEQEALKLDHEQRRAEERSAMAKFTASHNERHVNDAPDIRGAADAKFELARAERAETFEKKLANEQAGLDQRQASERSQAERSVSTPSVEPAKTTTSQPTLDR